MAGDSFLEVVESSARCLGCDSPRTNPALGWLSPRISFSSSFAELDDEPRISGEDYDATSTDFEFSMAVSNLDSVSAGIMLSADELFHNGKLLPLQLSSQLRMIESQSHAPNHKENLESPKISSHQSIQPAEEISPLHRPSSNFCFSVPPASGLFAPPSPETPKCSIMLRGLFGANKGEATAIREASGKLLVTSKLWKHFVRGVTSGGKKGAVTSSISENPLNISPASDCKDSKIIPSQSSAPLSSISSQISCSALMSERRQEVFARYENAYVKSEAISTPQGGGHALQLELESLENLISPGRSLMTRPVDRSGATSADDCNMLHSRRKARSGRSVSMPSSSWSSPERNSGKRDTKELFERRAEKFYTGSCGKVNSGRIIMKNLERCSSNQKAPVKAQRHCNGIQHREYWRAQEKVSSYTSNVRVTPVYNVPLSLAPSVKTNKLTKGRFSGLKEFFFLKKEI